MSDNIYISNAKIAENLFFQQQQALLSLGNDIVIYSIGQWTIRPIILFLLLMYSLRSEYLFQLITNKNKHSLIFPNRIYPIYVTLSPKPYLVAHKSLVVARKWMKKSNFSVALEQKCCQTCQLVMVKSIYNTFFKNVKSVIFFFLLQNCLIHGEKQYCTTNFF